ncbi:hypothetical protein QJQ45_022332 [Haematococcus lacustris]|nr:hypothetical protein QJQ45_022332 [Haematococcus lacustris]
MEVQQQTVAKLVLLGEMGSGKSSLVLRYVKGQFFDYQASTVGAAFLTKTIPELNVKFEIWDTAGQERYHSLAPMYYRGAMAAVIVYDITSTESLTRAKSWVKELQRQGNPNLIMALAGNKADLEEQRAVSSEEAAAYAAENNLFFLETSAKTAANVSELFMDIARKLPRVQTSAAGPGGQSGQQGSIALSAASQPPAAAKERSLCTGQDVSLGTYMTLPVEQYFVLDPKQIRHLDGNRFVLLVPRISIFNIWLEPEVEVTVTTEKQPGRVVLQAEHCRMKGSEQVERLQLNSRFCMRFVTQLTWSSGLQQEAQGQDGASAGPSGQIQGNSQLDVWCEVVPPFHHMPRSALVAACNTVLRALVGTLLPLFMRQLADDYVRWSNDPEYRAARAARSLPAAIAPPVPASVNLLH